MIALRVLSLTIDSWLADGACKCCVESNILFKEASWGVPLNSKCDMKFTYYICVFISADGTLGQFYAQADWLQRRNREISRRLKRLGRVWGVYNWIICTMEWWGARGAANGGRDVLFSEANCSEKSGAFVLGGSCLPPCAFTHTLKHTFTKWNTQVDSQLTQPLIDPANPVISAGINSASGTSDW